MKFCDICGSCMQRFVDNDAIIYKCACGMVYSGDATDACVYSETFDFDIDVTEKPKINPQNESAPAGKIEAHPQIVYNVRGNIHVGNSAQTDIKDSVIQRSNFGTEIPMEKKGCPRCQKKIEGNEKFCSECGHQLRE